VKKKFKYIDPFDESYDVTTFKENRFMTCNEALSKMLDDFDMKGRGVKPYGLSEQINFNMPE